MSQFTVLVCGSGLGGLCLAQSLRVAGIDVRVYERDSGPWDRPQGYRLHIDTDGVQALAAVLPREHYRLFEATAMRPLPFTTIVTTGFEVLRRVASDAALYGDPVWHRERLCQLAGL